MELIHVCAQDMLACCTSQKRYNIARSQEFNVQIGYYQGSMQVNVVS